MKWYGIIAFLVLIGGIGISYGETFEAVNDTDYIFLEIEKKATGVLRIDGQIIFFDSEILQTQKGTTIKYIDDFIRLYIFSSDKLTRAIVFYGDDYNQKAIIFDLIQVYP